ncbi:MAG: hypothetical protein HN368_16540 [Spirochaetales bacterium]|jgi:L-arabinose isomerase|nr:hypothetical protein [Spirochaetales bacterium]
MMPKNSVKAGFIPLYLKLYDDANPGGHDIFTPFIQAVQSKLESCGVSVVTPGTVFDAPHVEKASRMFAEENVSFVVTLHLCYSPSFLIADFLEGLNLPLLVLDTTPEAGFDGMKDDYLMRNHGIHGVMDLTSVLKSRNVLFTAISGHMDDEVFGYKFDDTVSAFRGAALMKNQKVGITGSPFEGMGDFSVDFDVLSDQFNTQVCDIKVDRIITEAAAADENAVKDRIQQDASSWDVSGISNEEHEQAVRGYLALRKITDEENLTGYTMNFQHIGDGMPTPFYGCSGLISSGIGYGGEGDVLTATLGRPLNAMSEAAKFDEFFCADWKNNRILMSHMGEADSRFIKKGSTSYLISRENLLNPFRSVIYRFRAEPGEVTFVNLSPVREGGYRLVAGLLDILDEPILDEIVGPHYQVGTRMDVGDFLEKYAAVGGGHHIFIARGNLLYKLSVFSKLLGFDYKIVTEGV